MERAPKIIRLLKAVKGILNMLNSFDFALILNTGLQIKYSQHSLVL